jgi:hypothetical protein
MIKKAKDVILKLDFEKAYDKVQWIFLMEVLKQKNFPPKWIEWTKQVVEGGKWVSILMENMATTSVLIRG